MPDAKRAWMVCDVNSRPCGEPFATYDEARISASLYAGGLHGYHARPVEITITVLGDPPAPWFSVVGSDGTVRHV